MATLKARLQPVEVTWHDAASEGGWRDLKDYRSTPLVQCRTVGFLSRYDKKSIQVVHTRSTPRRQDVSGGKKPTLDQERVVDSMTIPRQWAIRVRALR